MDGKGGRRRRHKSSGRPVREATNKRKRNAYNNKYRHTHTLRRTEIAEADEADETPKANKENQI